MTARLSLLLPAALAAAVLLPGAGNAGGKAADVRPEDRVASGDPGAGHAGDPVLTADVGLNDAYVIDLKDAGGASVSRLVPGTYTLVVHDHSALHSFHLVGPGVNVATTVAGTGDSTYTITLVAGNYGYHCDAHSYDMHGGFTVSAAATPALRLAAYVGPGARIGVSWSPGLKPGHAVIVVRDRSAGDNFRLTGPGIAKATGVAFRGTVTWTVTLRAGTYRYRSDRHAGLSGRFTVPR